MSIQVNDISKSFGEHVILKNITFDLYDEGRYALIGDNGAGKSTLLKILCGEEEYDDGEIYMPRNTRIGYLRQDSGLSENLTIDEELAKVFKPLKEAQMKMEDIMIKLSDLDESSEEAKKLSSKYSDLQSYFENNDGYNFQSNVQRILSGMGFSDKPMSTQISSLSGGEKTRLGLAKLLLESPDFLIMDEPTNHLDFETLSWLEGFLETYKGILLVVSHDRYFLDRVTNKTLEIENKTLVSYEGNYSRYLTLKEERMDRLWKEYESQQAEIEKLEDYVRKNITRASTSAMAKSRRKTLEKMEVLEKPTNYHKKINFKFSLARDPYKDLLEVKKLDIGFKQFDKTVTLMEDINFEVKRGDKVGIVGENGIGKSTLLKTIMGIIKPLGGKFKWGENAKIGYYEQETLDLDGTKTVIEELWDRYPYLTRFEVMSRLASIGLLEEDVNKLVDRISGGEKAKLKFAILSFQESNVLILDEPTNHLDLRSKEVLEKALNDYDGTLIFISHDRYFLNKIPQKIFEFTKTDGLEIYSGNYDYYIKSKERKANIQQSNIPVKKKLEDDEQNNKTGYKTKEDRRREAEKRKRIKELEESISNLEIEIKEIEERMALEEIYTDYEKLGQETERLSKSKEELDDNITEWSLLLDD